MDILEIKNVTYNYSNSKEKVPSSAATAWSTLIPSARTSGPTPSPGITAIL